MGTVSKKGKTSVSNQPSAGHKEYATKQKVYEEPKKGKGKAFLFLLIAVCLAVGAYFVIKLDVFNRIKYSEYKKLSDSKEIIC